MAVDIDEVLGAISEFGLYQRRIYFLLCLPIIFVGASQLSYVFLAAVPKYRCFVSGCDEASKTAYDEPFVNFTIPRDKNTGILQSCKEFIRSSNSSSCGEKDFSNDVENCQYGQVFDTTVYQSTIVTEFNLTCSRGWEAFADQSIYFGGILVGSFLFGILSDAYGRRKTFLFGIVLMSISGVTVALVPNLISFHVMRFINAVSTSGVFQTAFILGIEFVGPSKRVMCGVIVEYFFAFGAVFLGLIAWAVNSWRMLQLIISAPVACFLFYYWIVPESVRWLQTKGYHTNVVATLEEIAKVNKKTIPLNLLRHQPVEEEIEEPDYFEVLLNRQHKVTMLDILRSYPMSLRMFAMILIWIATTLTYYGLSFNVVDLGASSGPSKPYVNFVLSSLVELPGYSLAWAGMSYWGRRNSLTLSLLLSAIACATTGYLERYELYLLIVFLLGKCFITCAFAIIYVFTAELFPTSVRNTILGVCSMFARIGGMLAPFSITLRNLYVPLPMLVFGGLSFVCSLLACIMPETINTKLPDTLNEALNLGNRPASSGSYVNNVYASSFEEQESLLEDDANDANSETELAT